jgi:hypothetical protein
VDHEKYGHLTTLTSLENEDFPEMITWVVVELKEKRNLDIGWH